MKNFIKVALIGGATYLAIDYMMKRKANKEKQTVLVATANQNSIDSAEIEEEGEEGMAVEVAQQQQLGATPNDKPQFSNINSWDSDSLPIGA